MSNTADQSKTGDFVDGRVQVDVKIIRAEGLVGDKLNPYVTVTLGSDESQKKKTNVVKNSNDPVWDETFSFKVQDIETENLYINLKSKGLGLKDAEIGKRVKISFLSFHYGETKEVEKELHNKDQIVGKIFFQVSMHEDPKLKAEKESRLCFSVLAVEGRDLEDGDYAVQLKMKADDTSNPITASIHGTNPQWNEELFIKTIAAKKDKLKIVLLKNDKKCIESIKFNTADFSLGQEAVTFDDDVYDVKKQKVGHLKLVITPLDYNTDISKDSKYDLNVNLIDCKGYSPEDEPLTCDLQINGKSFVTSNESKNFKWNESFVVPCNNLQKDVFTVKPSKGDGIAIMLNSLQLGELREFNEEVPDIDDCYIHFTLQPGEHKFRTRSAKANCTDFSFDELSSVYSTSFSSLPTSEQRSISDFTPGEEHQHHHQDIQPAKTIDEIKPPRYDNVKGSLKSLSGLADPSGSQPQIYVTVDVLSHGFNKKKSLSSKSNECGHNETPQLQFDFQRIKKGNTLVFNIWENTGSQPNNIGVVRVPVKDIPEGGNESSLDFKVEKPEKSTLESDSLGNATFELSHTVDYSWPAQQE